MVLPIQKVPRFIQVLNSREKSGELAALPSSLFAFGDIIPLRVLYSELPALAPLGCVVDSITLERRNFLFVAARTYHLVVVNDPTPDDMKIVMQCKDNIRNSQLLFEPSFNVPFHRSMGIVVAVAFDGVLVDPRVHLACKRVVVTDIIEAVGDGGLAKVRTPESSHAPIVGQLRGNKVFCVFSPLPLDDGVVECLGDVADEYVCAVALYRFDTSLHKFLAEIRKDHDIDFSSLSLYQTRSGVQQFMETAGLVNFLDAQRLVVGLKALPNSKDLTSVVSIGEGFGFLAYHFKKLMPWVEFVGVDTSELMREVAASFGVIIQPERPVDRCFDLEILMNVVAFGVKPVEHNCIVLDNDMYFKGSGDFAQRGALLCRGDYNPRTIIAQKRRNFLYTTPCHRGVVLCQQEEVIPRAINTIGAQVVSTKLDLAGRRLPVSDEEPTVQFIDTRVDHPGLEPGLPVYMVDRFDYLISPEPLGQVHGVIGLPPGKYSFLTTTLVNAKNSVPVVLSGKKFGLDVVVIGKDTVDTRWYAGKMVVFHYHPVPTIKLYYDHSGRSMQHQCLPNCDCFKEKHECGEVLLVKDGISYIKAPRSFFYGDSGDQAPLVFKEEHEELINKVASDIDGGPRNLIINACGGKVLSVEVSREVAPKRISVIQEDFVMYNHINLKNGLVTERVGMGDGVLSKRVETERAGKDPPCRDKIGAMKVFANGGDLG